MLERVRSRVERREAGNAPNLGLGGVLDLVACFAQDGGHEEGSKAFLVDMVGLRLQPSLLLELEKEVERQNGGGRNTGYPLEGCRYRRMK